MRSTAAILSLVLSLLAHGARAQSSCVGTNLLSAAVLAPSVAVATIVSPKWTAGVEATGSMVATDSFAMRFIAVGLESRRWMYEPFVGHFVSFGAAWTGYCIGRAPSPHRGQGATVGIGYGYAWMISRRWDVECAAGIGLAFTADRRRTYDDPTGVETIHSYSRITLIPYSLRVAISYLF